MFSCCDINARVESKTDNANYDLGPKTTLKLSKVKTRHDYSVTRVAQNISQLISRISDEGVAIVPRVCRARILCGRPSR